ncbi:MAG: hypothetical protein LBH54_03745 [Clostridiales bacterium]|nr:hypothetical protein [Clostridiales bacterium]
MIHTDKQNEFPLAYCAHCRGEIYGGDTVYDLARVYAGGRCVVHEDCLTDSLEANEALVTRFLFGDLCLLLDLFGEVLEKCAAWDIFETEEEDVE